MSKSSITTRKKTAGRIPAHPGAILRDELAALGMSANALAIALRVPASRIDRIVKERRAVTPDTAIRLARYFGGEASFWLNLQQAHDLGVAESEHGKAIRSEVKPRAA